MLVRALSRSNTGSSSRGVANGDVAGGQAAAAMGVPAIRLEDRLAGQLAGMPPPAPGRPAPPPPAAASEAEPPAWDVWGAGPPRPRARPETTAGPPAPDRPPAQEIRP
ncbi:hypothetical protein [Azospirillum endophyticum]